MFGAGHEFGAHGIAFDVAADGQEVFVVLDREAFEASLIEVSLAAGLVVGVVAHGMGGGDPSHEAAHFAVDGWAEDQVPVIGHQDVAEELDLIALEPCCEDAFEGLVVFGLVEDRCAGVATVEGVVEAVGFVDAGRSWHGLCCN